MKPTDEQIAQLKATHGEVWTLEAGEDVLVFRAPTVPEFDAATDKIASDKGSKTLALRTLARQVVVFPSKEEYDAMAAKRAGLGIKLAGEAFNAASDAQGEFAKKA